MKIIAIFFLMALSSLGFSQVNKVNYRLSFNKEKCHFDVILTIKDGATLSAKDRAQLNSQVSVIVPTGSQVLISESYAPFVNNFSKRSQAVSPWRIGNSISEPKSLSGSDIYSFVPSTNITASYNDLSAGDEVTLFSVSIFPMVECGNGVRLFDNNVDPTSSSVGMEGLNFSNGFTLGGLEQKYNGNIAATYPNAPEITNIAFNGKTNGTVSYNVERGVSANCQGDLTYEWINANGNIIAKGSNIAATSLQNGTYSLKVTDELGCTDIESFKISRSSNNNQVSIANASGEYEIDYRNNAAQSVSIYPNPVKDVTTVSLSQFKGMNVVLSLTDVSGRQLSTTNVGEVASDDQRVLLNVNQPSGVYNVNIIANGKTVETKKIIVVQ